MLSPQALRYWKIATYAATSLTAFHVLFRTDYGPHDHVLSPVQSWYNRTIDRMIGVDADVAHSIREEELERRRQEGSSSTDGGEGTAWNVGRTGARGDTAEGAEAVAELRRRGRVRAEERDEQDRARATEEENGVGEQKEEPIPGLRWRSEARARARDRFRDGIMTDAIAAERDEAKEEEKARRGWFRPWGKADQ